MNIRTPKPSPKIKSTQKARGRVNGHSVRLRTVLETASAGIQCSLADLTVLSAQVDPYRLDTPSGHRDGQWVADQLGSVLRIHWRGLHYMIVVRGNVRKPNGEIYRNTEADWVWLSEGAGKAARWLGYIPFDRITDNRNSPPIIHRKPAVRPEAFISVGVELTIPDAADLVPTPVAEGFVPRQAYSFCIFGEKASLEFVLLPIARAKQADLYLPTGEISDTLLHQIAADAAKDGRPLVMFTLADCDPAGRQMSISIARKLQAFRDLKFPKLKFEVVPVALTVEQVRELGLPSTPLKETEARAGRWRQAFGVEQTEIDALATLQPEVLSEIVEHAFEPYFDDTLDERVAAAESEWQERAEAMLHEQIDPELLATLRTEAAGRLSELENVIADIEERMRMATGDRVELPAIEVPGPEVDEDAARQALVSFNDNWVKATRALIAQKQYGIGGGA
jgi:hypothetical protein